MNVKRILVVGAVAGMLAVTGCSSNLPENNQGNRNGQRVVDSVNRRGDTYNDFNAYDRNGGDDSTRTNRGFLRRSNRDGGRVTRAMRREANRLERGATEVGRETTRATRRATNIRPEHTFRYNQNAGTTTRGLNNNTATNFNGYDQGINTDCCDITGNTAVTRNSTIRNTVPTRNSNFNNSVSARRNSTIQNTVPTRNSTIQNTVPTRNSTIQNTVPTRNSTIQNTVPTRNSTIQNTVPTRNTTIRNTVPTRNSSITNQATVPVSNSITSATPAPVPVPSATPAPKPNKTRAVATATAPAKQNVPKAPEVKPQAPQATTQVTAENLRASVTRAHVAPMGGTVSRSFSTNATYPHPYASGAPTARLLSWPQSALSAPLGVPNEAEMVQILESRNANIQKNTLNLTPETNVRRLVPVEHSVSNIPVAVLVPSKDPGVTLEEALNRAERRALRRNHANPNQQTPAESPAPTSFDDNEFDEVDNEFNSTSNNNDNNINNNNNNDNYFNNQQNTTPTSPAPNVPVKPSERTMK